jgi:hypothetical protein
VYHNALSVYHIKFIFRDLRGEFPCDCDTVWFIRRLKMPGATKRFLDRHKLILCKADKAKRISKPVPVYNVAEAKICPQKGLC